MFYIHDHLLSYYSRSLVSLIKHHHMSNTIFYKFQAKFPQNVEAGSDTPGNNIQTRSLVVLNALGFIGFKVLGVAGTCQVNKNS